MPFYASALPVDWASIAGAVISGVDSFYGGSSRVFPCRSQVFHGFHCTKVDAVKVILLGVDLYYKADMADGLAFSQSGEICKRSSMHRITRLFAIESVEV